MNAVATCIVPIRTRTLCPNTLPNPWQFPTNLHCAKKAQLIHRWKLHTLQSVMLTLQCGKRIVQSVMLKLQWGERILQSVMLKLQCGERITQSRHVTYRFKLWTTMKIYSNSKLKKMFSIIKNYWKNPLPNMDIEREWCLGLFLIESQLLKETWTPQNCFVPICP